MKKKEDELKEEEDLEKFWQNYPSDFRAELDTIYVLKSDDVGRQKDFAQFLGVKEKKLFKKKFNQKLRWPKNQNKNQIEN
jgi:hypothetical protein